MSGLGVSGGSEIFREGLELAGGGGDDLAGEGEEEGEVDVGWLIFGGSDKGRFVSC